MLSYQPINSLIKYSLRMEQERRWAIILNFLELCRENQIDFQELDEFYIEKQVCVPQGSYQMLDNTDGIHISKQESSFLYMKVDRLHWVRGLRDGYGFEAEEYVVTGKDRRGEQVQIFISCSPFKLSLYKGPNIKNFDKYGAEWDRAINELLSRFIDDIKIEKGENNG